MIDLKLKKIEAILMKQQKVAETLTYGSVTK